MKMYFSQYMLPIYHLCYLYAVAGFSGLLGFAPSCSGIIQLISCIAKYSLDHYIYPQKEIMVTEVKSKITEKLPFLLILMILHRYL